MSNGRLSRRTIQFKTSELKHATEQAKSGVLLLLLPVILLSLLGLWIGYRFSLTVLQFCAVLAIGAIAFTLAGLLRRRLGT